MFDSIVMWFYEIKFFNIENQNLYLLPEYSPTALTPIIV